MQNKIQKLGDGTNVLVESKYSNSRHQSHKDTVVGDISKVSDAEILQTFEGVSQEDLLNYAKDWICKQDGFAHVQCVDSELGINYGSIVKFEKKKNNV